MTASLSRWISAADAVRHLEYFRAAEIPLELSYIRARADDYYISLVGDLFERMQENAPESFEWARLGNAFTQFVEDDTRVLVRSFINRNEAALYAAAAFYCGGFPASAYLSIRRMQQLPDDGTTRACYDLLARTAAPVSGLIAGLLAALDRGDAAFITAAVTQAALVASSARLIGPEEWVPARLYQQLLARFAAANLRAVLPLRPPGFWDALVNSFLARTPNTWEFFPSQIQAVRAGLLDRDISFTLQMPTGSGKTTLCETLLYDHLRRHPLDAAILLVPYRSLAAELRGSLVHHLNNMGISSRPAYGGTVPSGNEVRALQETQLLVATPEALSGLLSADQQFLQRISLVICDEGHLLDEPSRGIGLELLLARLRTRETGSPRFVFVSAIVPNVQEINAWLGGSQDSIVVSDYRPAVAEFAVLQPREATNEAVVDMVVHPHLPEDVQFTVNAFLSASDFRYLNEVTKRLNTYPYKSYKARAIAAARKALPMGSAVVFSANKRGNAGAVGLAEELIAQVAHPLTLPMPNSYAAQVQVNRAVDYLQREYGTEWIGTRSLGAGVVLHHGDIPQETREVLEEMLRNKQIGLAICTSTLAEGVNLPIRTLVLYSVERRGSAGVAEPLLSRDIKNLVGRAGRAGSNTKGLVICANERQWPLVERVAIQSPGENVRGGLRTLLDRLRNALVVQNVTLTNEVLENSTGLHALVDGIDSTLINLAAEEIGEEALIQLAIGISDRTFAAQESGPESRELLRTVFRLRAGRIIALRTSGQLGWIRETGARLRMLDKVQLYLEPRFVRWETLENPLDDLFIDVMLQWAWEYGNLESDIRKAYRLEQNVPLETVRATFFLCVRRWLASDSYVQIAESTQTEVDDVLAIVTGAIGFALQTVIEQGVALLGKLLESQGRTISNSVRSFPDYLRYGVSTVGACALSQAGFRHRRAAILLGATPEVGAVSQEGRIILFATVVRLIEADRAGWEARLGILVLERTLFEVIR
ncbi:MULTISPECIES: DEAD/DEAH box helicase [Acidobacteriaceae]|uniref:DEAD/DEAH box helicase n=1 Tax=Acidobacteriaceae TaxID=204434 RepID=UPI00131D43F1|nr:MULTISPECIES: DEAD/DEAH box helicase [Acidobacteriaceae]MDW5266093.1 DEAD/DEAH box helicase [Edaphobacter sp.]